MMIYLIVLWYDPQNSKSIGPYFMQNGWEIRKLWSNYYTHVQLIMFYAHVKWVMHSSWVEDALMHSSQVSYLLVKGGVFKA